MSFVGSNILAGASGQGGGGYEIERSLRFNSGDSAYLNRTFSAGNRKTWTWSGWVKRSKLGEKQRIFTAGSDGTEFLFENTDGLEFYYYTSSYQGWCKTNAVFRDISAWYHIVLAVDTTQSTSSDRVKIYVNGALQSLNFTSTFALNSDLDINNSVPHYISRYSNSATFFLDCYLAEVNFIDGQALAPTDFGETDDNGVWQPKDPTFTSPNNGTVWSDGITGSALSGYPATNGFDGNTSTWFYAAASQTTTFTFSPAITGTTFEIFALSGGSWPDISVNGTGIGTHNSVWVDVSSQANGSLSTISCPGGSGSQSGFSAVRVDGVILVDGANEYGTNGFHLDFKDNSSNAALGTDTSGNSNTWTVNNLTADVGTVGVTTTVPEALVSGTWADILGKSTLSAPSVVMRDGGGVSNSRSTFFFSGMTIGDTVTWYGASAASSAASTRSCTGNISETTCSVPGYDSPGSIDFTVTATSGSIKIDFNGDATCYGVTPGMGDPASIDSLVDTPTNGTQTDTGAGGEVVGNYATLNPLHKTVIVGAGTSPTFSNGNLDVTGNNQEAVGTFGASSGKWYYEVTQHDAGNFTNGVGWYREGTSEESIYRDDGAFRFNGPESSYGASWQSAGDVIGIALDIDNNTIAFYKNGSSQGNAKTNLPAGTYIPLIYCRHVSDLSANFGQRAFANTNVPSGYKALCTANLPEPTIADGSQYFDTTLWSGNNTARDISTNFSPDFVWTKLRNVGNNHNLFDSLRGVEKKLRSSANSAEATESGSLTAFNSDGFSLGTSGNVNGNNYTYVAWAWDAGSSNTTIAVGGLNSSVYNTDDVWSDDVTSTLRSGTHADNSFANTFNGQIGDSQNIQWTQINSNDTWTFAPSGGIASVTSLKAYVYPRLGTLTFNVNGTQVTTNTGNSLNTVDLSSAFSGGAASLTNLTITSANSGLYWGIIAVEVNGKLLVNTSASPPNVPTIASTVRANPSAGFSIVSYTGNATSGSTVGHGLNATPKMVIYKNRNDVSAWRVYNTMADGSLDWLYLDTTAAKTDSSLATFTNSVFTVGSSNDTNGSGDALIAYCFAPVEGYSAMGSYTGNGSADGPFVFTGFKVAFLLVKNTTSGIRSWVIFDSQRNTYNTADLRISPNSTAAELTQGAVDFLSNGFKIRNGSSAGYPEINTSGENFIYYAVAENPFKTARAR